jgi:hypothetical protein
MYLTEYPSALAFSNILLLYGILLSLIPKFANECVIEFYIRSMSRVTKVMLYFMLQWGCLNKNTALCVLG